MLPCFADIHLNYYSISPTTALFCLKSHLVWYSDFRQPQCNYIYPFFAFYHRICSESSSKSFFIVKHHLFSAHFMGTFNVLQVKITILLLLIITNERFLVRKWGLLVNEWALVVNKCVVFFLFSVLFLPVFLPLYRYDKCNFLLFSNQLRLNFTQISCDDKHYSHWISYANNQKGIKLCDSVQKKDIY